jgi:hypothetical protein
MINVTITKTTGHLAMFQIVRPVEPTPTRSPTASAIGPLRTSATSTDVISTRPISVTATLNGHWRYHERPRLASHRTLAAHENVPM